MIKIGILNKGPKFNWGKNFGYWFYVKYFKNELRDYGYDVEFYDNDNKKFYKYKNNNFFVSPKLGNEI